MPRAADPLANFDDVPWDRIVHFYDRATEIPGLIRQLATKDHEAAEERLLECLVHQDGVTQATPFAVFFIIRLLKSGPVRDPEQVQCLLKRIGDAARSRLEDRRKPRKALDWTSLLAEERLWPKFTSKRADENYWEEWDTPKYEWLAWQVLTNELVTNALAGPTVFKPKKRRG